MSADRTLPFVGSVDALASELESDGHRYRIARLGASLGLARIGVNHEVLPPGGRSSKPHAHRDDEEFVFVVEGTPTLWIDGETRKLAAGDAVAFPAGTGIAHTFLNESGAPVSLLIVGEHSPDDRVAYPVNPEMKHPRPWSDAPRRPLGPHPGVARRRDEA